MTRMRTVRIAAAVVAAVALSACDGGPPPDASGEEIYLQSCARCHGEDLGGGIGPPLGGDSAAAHQPDEFYHQTIADGRGRMPSFSQTLTEGQIDRVVEYLRIEQGGP